ncbi:MAG: flavodoxin domain-containing protein [Candidatus Liptonbacteria bacterium]
MQILIVYDSAYGNTGKIALAMAGSVSSPYEARAMRVGDTEMGRVASSNIIILGCPTQGGRPTQNMRDFISKIPAEGLKGKRVAAFDTRFEEKEQSFALRLLMKTIGYAAPEMMKELVARGGVGVVEPEGFIVNGKEGPLKEGELEQATNWARKIIDSCASQ